jgi:hypothetical protein
MDLKIFVFVLHIPPKCLTVFNQGSVTSTKAKPDFCVIKNANCETHRACSALTLRSTANYARKLVTMADFSRPIPEKVTKFRYFCPFSAWTTISRSRQTFEADNFDLSTWPPLVID